MHSAIFTLVAISICNDYYFHLLGAPGSIDKISYQVSSLSSTDHVYMFYEWEYQLDDTTVKNFVSEISSKNMSIHQMTVNSNVRSAYFNVSELQMRGNMFNLMVTVVGHCGENESYSVPIDTQISGKECIYKYAYDNVVSLQCSHCRVYAIPGPYLGQCIHTYV